MQLSKVSPHEALASAGCAYDCGLALFDYHFGDRFANNQIESEYLETLAKDMTLIGNQASLFAQGSVSSVGK